MMEITFLNLVSKSLFLLGFSTNADAENLLIFGKTIETWLIYTVILFGFTSLAFMGTWALGFLREKNSVDNLKQPWE